MKTLMAIFVLCSGVALSQFDTSSVILSRNEYNGIIETLEKVIPYLENKFDCTLMYKTPEQRYREMADILEQKERDLQEFKVLLWWLKEIGK